MKAIVFGGSGFLGSHIADELLKQGYETIIYDKTPSAYLIDGQRMIVGDILDIKNVEKAVKDCDYVYNFAGIADLDEAREKPLETVNLNILGNINILEASVKSNVKRFIYASSIYVYSQKGGFYRCSKQASEIYIEEYSKYYGLEYTILRYGSIYGPRADKRNPIYRYLRQALEGEKIKCSNPEETREYIHVRDAAKLSVEILNDKFANRHIILSGHYKMKVKEMMLIIKEIMNNNIEVDFIDSKRSDGHYNYTPYSYSPKIGDKLLNDCYVDIGQGILECLEEINRNIPKRKK
ncbi:MAG: NAD(P)-dependent oxidoreductase [Candidatus Ratteibacteria bacterium]|nr:NAD(P)-dependent oxidoreductase [Candidatus Ratteibacteria bacterium]